MRTRLAAPLLAAPLLAAPLLAACAPAAAVAGDPELAVVLPRGARAGTTQTFSFVGKRLRDAAQVLFYEPGFTVTKIEPAEDEKEVDFLTRVTVEIAADVPPGEHLAQLRTDSGLSPFVSFYTGTLPELEEVEPNGPGAPQPVPADAADERGGLTVTGVVQNEDLDHFALDLAEGQVVTVEVDGLRLGSDFGNAFDPTLAVLGPDGREVAASDDTPHTAADPLLSFAAPVAGTYELALRDAEYGGGGRAFYRMHLALAPAAFPRPRAVYPAGGTIGEPTEVTFLGDAAGDFTQTVVPLPGRTADATGRVRAERDGAVCPSPLPFRASTFENTLEVEPNDSRETATAGPQPSAFNGLLQEPGDEDWFAFEGKKGWYLRLEVFGRRLGSPIDPVLDLFGPDGKHVKGQEDTAGPDPRFDQSLPADGVYHLRVRDHLGRGGPLSVYRLECSAPPRTPTLTLPRHGRYGQARQRVAVPRGGRYATRVTVSRNGLGGELTFDADRLPAGVTLSGPPVPKDQVTWPALFTAAADAPLSGAVVDVRAFQSGEPAHLAAAAKRKAAELFGLGPEIAGTADRSAFAGSLVEADFVRYRNNEMLWGAAAPGVGVAVVEKLPYAVEVVPPAVPIVRDGTLDLVVNVHREDGFDGEILLQFPQRVGGLGCDYQLKVPAGVDTFTYPLNANDKAALGTFPFFVLANGPMPGDLNGGRGECTSELFDLTIAETPFTLTVAKGAVERGGTTAIAATLVAKPDSPTVVGTATVTLQGLPEGLTCEPVEVAGGASEFVFTVAATAEAPLGTRKGLVAEVVYRLTGDETRVLTWKGGTTDLRVDPAPPAPAAETPPPAAVADAVPAAPKPLSRLEKLRRRAAAGATADPAPAEGTDR